ncbi:FHA domain-containing protein [Bradyrhizobium sp. 83012]|uniref:FHA domain-containing protein n=1 Tax=Bradyrhizobium aeschynomenes TaxID=2734909 RepID=A0ABX2CA49_9BRAD|nr:FHA domain-containing protein [Bradyrhizobium aeschynomenes]NPU64525.1 FHA domain-containing protein [Bradyrhizobium aeschynomenes]
MIWIEILSKHRDVAGRFRVDAAEISIGRGYDNHVILDDPYVAARHVRIFRDEEGRLVAEDLGSANGLYLGRSKSRKPQLVLDGSEPIRVGQTLLRVRDAGHAVEPERLAGSERGALPIVAAIVLGAALVALNAILVWFAQTSEPHLSDYLVPTLTLIGVVVAWVGVWALLARLFSGRSHFLRHLLIAQAGLVAFFLYSELAQIASFALTWTTVFTYGYVVSWVVFAAICFLHLREVGRTHMIAKGIVVGVLLMVAIAVQSLQRSEAFTNSGRPNISHVLMPPSLRLVPLRTEQTFMDDVAGLKARLDADRAELKPASVER